MKIARVLKPLAKWVFILLVFYHITKSLLSSYLRVYGNAPEAYMTTSELIINRGYPVEVHHVVSEDGYILEMKRIPSSNKCQRNGESGLRKKPVLLQHGMMSSDHVYLVNSNENALAYVLADRCFDVWLANSRGNTYSRRHVTLSPEEEAFWDHSWDEMGRYDISANIEYILKTTGEEKIAYVGHSLGCTLFYIAMIEHPHLNDKIEIMFSLAPTTSVANLSNFLVIMAPFIEPIRLFLKWSGSLVYSDCQSPIQLMAASLCQTFDIFAIFGGYLLFNLYGVSTNYDQAAIDALPGHYPAGGSFKVKMQFLQNYNSGKNCNRFDYGSAGNVERYGSSEPLPYDLSMVRAPVVIFSADTDPFAPDEDIAWLASRLGNLKALHRIAAFSHGDFIWSNSATEMVYDRLVSMISPAEPTNHSTAHNVNCADPVVMIPPSNTINYCATHSDSDVESLMSACSV